MFQKAWNVVKHDLIAREAVCYSVGYSWMAVCLLAHLPQEEPFCLDSDQALSMWERLCDPHLE